MKKDFFNPEFDAKLAADGWNKIDPGSTRRIRYSECCSVFVKEQKFDDIIKMSSKTLPSIPCKSSISDTPSKNAMESLRGEGVVGRIQDPSSIDLFTYSNTDYSDYILHGRFLSELQSSYNNLIIRLDCCYIHTPSNIVSYNISFVGHNSNVITLLVFPYGDCLFNNLSLNYLLGLTFDYLKLDCVRRDKCKNYSYIKKLNDLGKPIVYHTDSYKVVCDPANCVYGFVDGKPSTYLVSDLESGKSPKATSSWSSFQRVCKADKATPIPVTLLLYRGLGVLSSLDCRYGYTNVLSYANNIRPLGSSVFTHHPICLSINSVSAKCGWEYCYNCALDIHDVVCLNGTGINCASYDDFGRAAGCKMFDFSKMGFHQDFKQVLNKFIEFSPALYADFARRKNIYVLMYICRVCGINKRLPVTLQSAGSKVARNHIMDVLRCENYSDFLKVYAGVRRGRSKLSETTQKQFMRHSLYIPLNFDCDTVQRYAALSYRGGFNACFSVDLHTGETTTNDVDLPAAYPTAMNIIPLVDWSNPILNQFSNRPLTLDDFRDENGKLNPMTPIFAYVTYHFPDSCLFPNLPRNNEEDNEAPCYPLIDETGVYCSGPELYLALKFGATIYVHSGFVARLLKRDGTYIYPYRDIVCDLVRERMTAVSRYGKKSLGDSLHKLLVSTLYGKTGQGVKDMYAHDSSDKDKKTESEITNNVSAALITAFIRCVLFAAFAQITERGYHVYSATTDGLITDMPCNELSELDLFGFRELLVKSRQIITGETSPAIWTVKHTQTDLYNISTRGNVSLAIEDPSAGILGGVIAKNGVSSKFRELPKEDFANRKAFFLDVLGRTGKVCSYINTYSAFSDVKAGLPYVQHTVKRLILMNYDMKRKPIEDSLCPVFREIDGVVYEVAHIETVPFRDSDEFLLYRKIRLRHPCLKTVNEWKRFFADIRHKQSGDSLLPINDKIDKWKSFCDCIAGYKEGLWDIPELSDSCLSVSDKVDWLQFINPCSDHLFNLRIWNKMSEKSRQAKKYPIECLQDMLDYINGGYKTSLVSEPVTDNDIVFDDEVYDDYTYFECEDETDQYMTICDVEDDLPY